MSQVATQTQDRGAAHRGRRGPRGRGAGRGASRGRGGGRTPTASQRTPEAQHDTLPAEAAETKAETEADNVTDTEDSAVCWICAEPVKYYSVSECNHRTCHVCALRLRALYKRLDCTFCKEPQASVIFTVSPDALWSSFAPEAIPYKDPKLSISFETEDMMQESLILLRFNCPDRDCDYIANGWSDLKLHTRATHGKVMCDLCIRSKKVFSHEHILYHPNLLPFHLPSTMRSHRPAPKEQIEGGVHPICEFCRECFFGDDELFAHMRERHEECFVCKRNEVKDQYFKDYESLERHFTQAHFPCTQSSCLARKFVVFGSALDLKAHMVEEHGADMSTRDKKEAMRIEAEFEFEEVGVGGRRGRRDRGDREREREPPPHVPRPGAAGARRREAFSGHLTVEGSQNAAPTGTHSGGPSRRHSPSPAAPDVEPAVLERHTAFLARVSSLAPNPNAAVPAVKAAVRQYRVSESAARDLILTVWNVLDRNLESTASIINALVDLLEEEDKKKDLLAAWNGFKVEQRNQFPDLVPSGLGTEWAGITGGRVLNAKQSTAPRSALQSSRVLDRVARAAASSSSNLTSVRTAERFPALQPSAPPVATSGFRQPQRNTPWASSSVTKPAPVIRGPTSVPGPGARVKATPAPAPTLSKSAFPELPTSSASRVPKVAIGGNQSLRNIVGGTTPTGPVWGSGKDGASGSGANTPAEPPEGPNDGTAADRSTIGKGKKGKGKQKQTLFTLGSFPT